MVLPARSGFSGSGYRITYESLFIDLDHNLSVRKLADHKTLHGNTTPQRNRPQHVLLPQSAPLQK
jgi:hypothetical protein